MTDIVDIGLSVDSRPVKDGTKSLKEFGNAADRTGRDVKEFEGRAKKATTATQRLSHSMSSGAKMALSAAAAYISVSAAIDFGREVISTTAEFEKLNAMLVTATGSTEAASVAFEQIKEFATSTPYQLSEVTTSFIKLKNLGLDPSERALMAYGNTASAMGKSMDQMIEAVADASVGEFERLKEFGIKANKQGDQVSFMFRGITTTVANSSEEIQNYLMGLGENDFAGSMARQMDTINGKISNMEDVWATAFNNIGSSNSGFIGSAIQGMTDLGNAIADAFDTSTNAQIRTLEDSLFEMQDRLTEISKLKRGWFGEVIDAGSANMEIQQLITGIARVQGEIDALEEQKAENRRKAEEQNAKTAEVDQQKAEAKREEAEKQAEIVRLAEEEFKWVREQAAFEAETRAQIAEEESQQALEEKRQEELEQLQEFKERQLAIEMDYYDRLYNLQAGSQQAALDFSNSVRQMDLMGALKHGASMLSNVAKQNKGLFEVQKAFALANAAVTLPSAVIKSFENGGGYPFGIIPAALMAAEGASQIAAIQSSSFGGGASAPSISGGGDTGMGAPVATGLPNGSTAVPSGDEVKPVQQELKVVIEGDSPNSEGMRSLVKNLAETMENMGGTNKLVLG